MSERQTRSSRHLQPSRNKKLDKLLNVLIGIVVILIIITATIVFKWQDDAGKAEKDEPIQEQKHDNENVKDKPSKEQNNDVTGKEEKSAKEDSTEETQTPEKDATIETTSDNPIVDKVITNKNWQPTPTAQSGQHVSSYDDQSIDWAEKVATVTAVTSIEKDNMIIWRMGNNGGANSAIATVSTKDKTKMYRVSMEWVDNEGWQPVKVEQLNTLNGAY